MSAECFDCPSVVEDCYLEGCNAVDGSVRPAVSTNTQIPGPSIQVCHGDTVRVRLINELVDHSGLTIHWYGMHQIGTNWMDGASMITQCPVPQSSSFVYKFIANPAGTHWWHAHSGYQRDDGMFGSLIVKQPKEAEQNSNEYDVDVAENVIMLLDWSSRPAISVFLMTQSPSRYIDTSKQTFSMLVNGRAISKIPYTGDTNDYYTPLSTFEVDEGLAYRFRLISGVFGWCNMHVSVESHPLTIIALDGYEVMPTEVDSLVVAPGERVDFVLKATAYPSSYCIYFYGTDTSNCTDNGAAMLVYKNQSFGNKICTSTESSNIKSTFSLFDTHALEPLDPQMSISDEKYVISLTSHHSPIVSNDGRISTDGRIPSYQIDNVVFSYPSSPFLTPNLRSFETCSPNGNMLGYASCSSNECRCTNVLKLKQGQIVDFFVINKDSVSHSMHLHGNSFRILALDSVEDITHWTSDKLANVRQTPPELAVIKDTVNVPAHGYAIIRLLLNNPGYWITSPTSMQTIYGMSPAF
ncbi:laccase-1-like [Anneissia japonica]|uniref:laccase-1-like n=1 Tax=Anneissia japonica TaxID=1529436 RepID=UPI001425A70F|nr:laccase-1-like [Anneissia japonica]